MSRVSKKVGLKIRKFRQDMELSQLRLAESAGLDVTTVNEIEKGHREPVLGTLAKLAKALRVSISEFVD